MPMPESAAPPTDQVGADLRHLMRDATEGAASSVRLAVAPTAPFFLRHHPEAWEVVVEGMNEPTWVPILVPHFIVPGAAGIRTLAKGMRQEEAFRDSVSRAQTYEGWSYLDRAMQIPADLLPRGVPSGGYCRSMPCADPRTGSVGHYHCEAWNVPVATPPGRRQRFAYDRGLYNRFRAWLVEEGILQPPADYVFDERRAKVLRTRERKQAMTDVPADLRQETIARSDLQIEQLDAAVVPGQVQRAENVEAAPKAPRKAAPKPEGA